MGLGLDSLKVSKKVIVPPRRKTWWLPVLLVCTLFLLGSQTTFTSAQSHPPVFDYVSSPNVHLLDNNITFKCVFSPINNPTQVSVHIDYPNSSTCTFDMIETSQGKYVNITSFNLTGQYSFVISAIIDNQFVYSICRSFWITTSLSDQDNDKMHDDWERFYGLNFSNPMDAFGDIDNDGFKNLDEFTMKTDPLEADYIEFIVFFINSHFRFIILTMFFSLIALCCSLIGLRRSTRWI